MGRSNPQYMDFSQNLPNTNLTAPIGFGFGLNEQDNDGKTQLHRAAISKDMEQVERLLFAGIAVDIKDRVGNEPLHYGVIADEPEIVKLLLRFGANVNAKGQLGCSPLHLAVSHKDIVNALLQEGANVSRQDDKGDTPLHLALSIPPGCPTYNCAVIDALLQSRADVNLANEAGITPFLKLLDQPYDFQNMMSHGRTIHNYMISFLESGASVTKSSPDNETPLQIFLSRSTDKWFQKKGLFI